jgi:poly-gamma-glutamate synthesis protein (capsule biosynthesis protein)
VWLARVAVVMAIGCGNPRREAPAPAAPEKPIVAVAGSSAPIAPPIDAAIAVAAPDAAPSNVADHIELTFTGDIMFGGTFSGKWRPQEAGTFDPLAEIAPKLKADFVLPNLETTVVAKIPVDKLVGDLRFAARPDQVATLTRNGVHAVTIANNHANDIDGPGVIETATRLKELGITAFGAARADGGGPRVETVDVRGWRVGIIASTVWLNRGQRREDPKIPLVAQKDFTRDMVKLVKEARADHDLVFVVVHWGIQYVDDPEKWQVDAAHDIIDAGADALIGHHPHLLHRIERYKNGVIAYSLGNFLFNNALPLQRNTGILRLGFSAPKHCLDLVVLHPAAMYSSPVHHPRPVTGTIFDEIVARMTKLARNTPIKVEGDHLVVQPVCPR